MEILRPGFRPLYSLEVAPVDTYMMLAASPSNSEEIPLRIPSPIPSSTTRIKIPEATERPVRKVRNLFLAMVSKISCQRSRSNICYGLYFVNSFVIYDKSVLQGHYPLR